MRSRTNIVFLLLIISLTAIGSYLWLEDLNRYNPDSLAIGDQKFSTQKMSRGAFDIFLVKDQSGVTVDSSLGGSRELVCDPPYIIKYDLDKDGNDDLYLHHCGGHGYLAFRSGQFEYTALDDSGFTNESIQPGWLFGIIDSRFAKPFAFICLVSAFVLLAIALVLRTKKRNRE